MSDVKPGVVTTVPLCSQCNGTRKVYAAAYKHQQLPCTLWVPCKCVLESIESNEARISGLERLFLRHEGMDISLLGEPVKQKTDESPILARMTGRLVAVFKDESGVQGAAPGWLVRVLCSDGLLRVYDCDQETMSRALAYMRQEIDVDILPWRANAWDVMPAIGGRQ